MNQQTRITNLKDEIAAGRVVVVAGTGVSIMACEDQLIDGHPVARWDGLLRHGVDHCLSTHQLLTKVEAKILNAQIKSGAPDFLVSAAELITARLRGKSPGTYRGWLKDTVGKLSPTQPAILQILASFPGVLATLNYDSLFEQATPRHAITWLQPEKVQDVLFDRDDNAVLHLHGYFDEPDSVVLGLRSYELVANAPHAKAVRELFTVGRTLLFVGCGGTFRDPNFSRLIEWANQVLSDTTHAHFRLCRKSELRKIRAEQPQVPWLYPLVYGEQHTELVPFLRSLAPAARHRSQEAFYKGFCAAGVRHQ